MRAHLRRCLSCVLWTTKNNECGRFSKERGGAGREGERGTGGRERQRERESMMLAEDNALNTTFRELDLSKQRGKI